MNEPTVQDLLARHEIDAAWAAAEAGTPYASMDWRAILAALVAAGAPAERIRRCAERVVAAADAALDTWGFAEAAVALHGIGAEEEARGVLGAARAALEARSTRAYEWGLVAQGVSRVAAFRPEVGSLLARGAEVAAARGDFDGLAGLAGHLHRIGQDPGGAAALAAAAERLWRAGAEELRDVWPVANAWHALGRLAERDRLLDEAAARAATLADRLILARIWRSHEDGRAAGVVAEAAALARTAEDWYRVAEAAHECGAGRDLVRRALREARAAAPATELAALIDQAGHAWLGLARDHATSLRPEDLRPRRRLLVGWPSSASALLDWLGDRMTGERIERIARADYGMDFAAHRAALETLVADRVVAPELGWVPGEVLGLFRWETGDRVDHVARAFAATVLLVHGQDPALNAGVLVESVVTLGAAALGPAMALLVHVYECAEEPEPALRYGVALLACAAGRPADTIERLVEDVGGEALAAALGGRLAAPRWRAVSAAFAGRLPPLAAALAATVAALLPG